MKRILSLFMIVLCACSGLWLTACKKNKETVVIYTSTEDYTMELLQERLDEQFPNYDIVIEYMSTSNIAAKVIEEKSGSECDIVYALEYGYLEKMAEKDVLADISDDYDMSIFESDAIIDSIKDYSFPSIRTGGAIIINNYVLSQKGLPKPTSYDDLLDSKYKDVISMPNPESSGTGYMFYLSLVNAMGETEAIEYFDDLSENIIAYTSSGSGPVNALVSREAGIGLGMISQAAEKITSGVDELEILIFDEGSPYNLYGTSIIAGKETRAAVKEVMNYIYSDFNYEACETYYPEALIKDETYNVANFPKNIKYADMSNNTLTRKEELLEKWSH